MQRSRHSSISIWLFSIVIFAGPFSLPAAHSQVVGASISGTIHDASGAAIVGAHVTVTNQETGAVRNLVSDSTGSYSAPSLAVGRYKVTVEKQGFGTRSETGINLVVGQSTIVNLSLSVGTLQQQVSVTDIPLAINTTTQPTSGLVSARQVKELPLNGRSYDELITLNPAIRELHGRAVRRCRHVELFSGKYVFRGWASSAGQFVFAEWN